MVTLASTGSDTVPPTSPIPDMQAPAIFDGDASPSDDGDEPLDIDQDDVQSFIQPALSPVATRLTLPKTPAAEKAAAMDQLPGGGLFDIVENTTPADSTSLLPPRLSGYGVVTPISSPRTRQQRGFTLGQLPSNLPYLSKFPSPWVSGPKELVVDNESGSKSAMATVFGQSRHQRASSGGQDTLRKLREALPSISLPSFFSGSSSTKPTDSDAKGPITSNDGSAESKQVYSPLGYLVSQDSLTTVGLASHAGEVSSTSRSPSSLRPSRPRAMRRSTSDESMLYHSLSRVSSYGDDERWNHIREQRNSRLKAITDSWDRPTFKLPQLPNILPAPLKKNPLLSFETSETPQSDQFRSLTVTEAAKDSNISELDRALESLTGDVVVMGGYRGSILRSTRTRRQVWVPVKLGLNIRKANLEVGLEPEDEERMEDTIYPSGMLQNIGPVDISRRLIRKLRECDNTKTGKLRVWDYGYDWRLSPHLLSRKLIDFLRDLPSNQGLDGHQDRGATVIAHSLGGLITRHAVNQQPELFAGVIYAGTPQKCINVLGPLRNGDAVLFNEKVLTAQVNFSLRTSFVFLPEDGFCFINKHTGEEYPVDFYDPQAWIKYAWSPCIEPALPAYNSRGPSRPSLRELSERLPSPLRSRGNSAAGETRPSNVLARTTIAEAARKLEVAHDRTLAPQIGTLSSENSAAQQQQQNSASGQRDRNLAYLTRTLADIKRFRAETYYQSRHTETNSYPPLAVIYGKDIPTVWAAHVSCRDAIACTDAYDDLVFRSGDGVVLAKEAMVPEGYELVRGGRISTDRGHITILGDLESVGKALQAVIRGRRKGIGLGHCRAVNAKSGVEAGEGVRSERTR